MKTKLKVVLVTSILAILSISYAQEGGAPQQGSVADSSTNDGCTCQAPVCVGYGTGCYQCGTVLCLCNCYSGQTYMQEPNLVSQPC